ncbi:Carbon monoxide oxidation accessory protein CoxE [Minicystis rosea]|nr:Carbon monoxide oxidation accessory protein CoxE [Minicystis rosea]
MLRILDELLWALRRDGFAISTAQAIDAARVTSLVGFDERATLRDALGAVILERRSDRDRFRASFDAFFAADRAHAGDLWSRLRARGFRDDELGALRELLQGAAERSGATGDAPALRGLIGSESELDQILRAAGIARVLAPMTSPLQVGFFAQKVMNSLELPRAASALRRIGAALREALGEARGAALEAALAEELDRARRRIRMHVERTIADRTADPDAGARRRADGTAFAGLTEAEREEVRRAVRSLAERLRGAERVRRKRALRGRIDPHRTLRLALRTGGVPFTPARKRRRRDKPRLVVLCDVSDSVRAASLFMLELVHAAQELFRGTRSFVFVSELAETTHLFDDLPPDTALARIYGGGVVSLAHNSNYGRVLSAFEERVGRSIDRRTTVVILGDGRTNYLADGADVVARLRERARALVWISPEGPGSWGNGDSAMLRYQASVTRVVVARTARELEDAARAVAALRG